MTPLQFDFITNTIFILWILSLLRNTSMNVYIWQRQEYRVDRFLEFIRSKDRKLLFNMSFIVKAILILFFPIFLHYSILPQMLFGYFVLEFVFFIYAFLSQQLYRPVFTKKAILLLVLSIIIEASILVSFPTLETLFGLEVLRFILVTLLVFGLKPPTLFAKKRIMRKAAKIMRQKKDMKVIGITGSYGKTSTKEMLYTMLSDTYRTLRTPRHINTDIGVAKTIINKAHKDYDVFVVEMGAYKKGEIKSTCDIVKPDIGVLTGINRQHISLFGSFENIHAAKFELPLSVPSDGIAIMNGDVSYNSHLVEKIQAHTLFYSVEECKGEICAKNFFETDTKISFDVLYHNDEYHFSLPLHGIHNIANFLACVLCCRALGMTMEQIQKAAKNITPTISSIRLFEGINNSLIIDDSYNSNYHGFLAALEILAKKESKRKILVTQGILELGEHSFEVHEKLGKRIGEVVHEVVLLNKDLEEPIRSGAGDRLKITTIQNHKALRRYLLETIREDDIVLVENRIPGGILPRIAHNYD